MNIEEIMASLYNRDFVPLECGSEMNNPTTKVLLKLYDNLYPHDKDEEHDFITTDPIILRNTAINSLIGKPNITEEQIQTAMRNHVKKQHEFYVNWKLQQVMNIIGGDY
ncbi:Uncharacterized protein QTN25_003127 [Entamoeba marina]